MGTHAQQSNEWEAFCDLHRYHLTTAILFST